MDAVELCRQTILDLRGRLKGRTEYDIVRMAGLVRQLLFDKHPLLPGAVRQSGRKFVFQTREIPTKSAVGEMHKNLVIHWLGDMNPDPSEPTRYVKIEAYGGLLSMCSASHAFSIREVIRFVANKKGGIHLDNQLDEDQVALDNLAKMVELDGSDAVMKSVICISENVVASALKCGWIT